MLPGDEGVVVESGAVGVAGTVVDPEGADSAGTGFTVSGVVGLDAGVTESAGLVCIVGIEGI
ncbi:MAG: hypothetical protein C4287_20800 [Leptolyngbya sp. ERB_1_2]